MSAWTSVDRETERLILRFNERPGDYTLSFRIAERYYEGKRYELARKYYRFATGRGLDTFVCWVQKGRCNVHVWRQSCKDTDLEEALYDFNHAMLVMDRQLRRDPLVYMEMAAVAYKLHRYKDMTEALSYVIIGYRNSPYTGMAIHLAAQILYLDKQYQEAKDYYNNLLISPPTFPSEPASCLDLLPRPVYNYSIILESACVSARLGQRNVFEEGVTDIHNQLQHMSEELGHGFSDIAGYEPYDGKIRTLPLDIWLQSPVVWRVRLLRYLQCESYIFATFFCDRLVELLSSNYAGMRTQRGMRRWQISDTLLIKADCMARLGRDEDAFEAAMAAVKWSPRDPVSLCQAFPHLHRVQPQDEAYQKMVERHLRAARLAQTATRRYLLWPHRGARIVRRSKAAIRIQTIWRAWEAWNRMAEGRADKAKARGIYAVRKLMKEYKHARPSAIAKVRAALDEAEFTFQALRSSVRALVAVRRLLKAKRAALKLQAVLRGYVRRWQLRREFQALIGRTCGLRQVLIDEVTLPPAAWPEEDPSLPVGENKKVIVKISCKELISTPEDSVAWLPFGLMTDNNIMALLDGADTILVNTTSFKIHDLRRLLRVLASLPAATTATTLLLCRVCLDGEGLESLTSFLQSEHCRITSLGLTSCELNNDQYSNDSIRTFGKSLMRTNCPLRQLVIEDNEAWGDKGLSALLPYIQRNTSLRSVGLRRVGLTDKSVGLLANTILICPHLRAMNLSENSLGCSGVHQLLHAVWNRLDDHEQKEISINLSLQDQDPPLMSWEAEKLAMDLMQQGINALVEVPVSKNGGVNDLHLIGQHSLLTSASLATQRKKKGDHNKHQKSTAHASTKNGNQNGVGEDGSTCPSISTTSSKTSSKPPVGGEDRASPIINHFSITLPNVQVRPSTATDTTHSKGPFGPEISVWSSTSSAPSNPTNYNGEDANPSGVSVVSSCSSSSYHSKKATPLPAVTTPLASAHHVRHPTTKSTTTTSTTSSLTRHMKQTSQGQSLPSPAPLSLEAKQRMKEQELRSKRLDEEEKEVITLKSRIFL